MAEAVVAAFAAVASAVATYGTAAAAVAAGTATVGTTIAVAAVNIGISAVLSAGINALAPKPPVARAQMEVSTGSIGPCTHLMGRTAVRGHLLTPQPLYSGKNDRVGTRVYALSGCGPTGRVTSIIFKGETVTFDAQGYAIGKYGNGQNNATMRLIQNSGDWNQAALNSNWQNANPAAWDASKRAVGCLTVMIQYHLESKVYGTGLDNPIFVVESDLAVLTDPRTGQAATSWDQRQNPGVWAWSFSRGFFAPGDGSGPIRVLGLGTAAANVDQSFFASMADNCDIVGYRITGEISAADSKLAVLSAIMRAGAAMPCERLGLQSGIQSAPAVITTTLTENDIIGHPQFSSGADRHTLPNTLIPRALHESSRWDMVDYTPIKKASWLTDDGGIERSLVVDHPFAGGTDTQRAAQVAKITAIEGENAREAHTCKVTVKFHKANLAFNGNAIETIWPRYGHNNRKWRVVGCSYDPFNGNATWTLTSETDAKYTWAYGVNVTPIPNTYTSPYNDVVAPTPDAAQWAATLVTSGVPIIKVTGSMSDYMQGSGWTVAYRIGAGPSLGFVTMAKTETIYELGAITPNAAYTISIAYRNEAGNIGPFFDIGTITTGTLVSGDSLRLGGILAADIIAGLGAATSDKIFSPSEKRDLVPAISELTNTAAALSAEALALGITTERTAFLSAMSALTSRLNGLMTPFPWYDPAGITDIPFPVAFTADVSTALQRRSELIAAMAREASKSAVVDAATGRITKPDRTPGAVVANAFIKRTDGELALIDAAAANAATLATDAQGKANDLINGVRAAFKAGQLGTGTTETTLNAQFSSINSTVNGKSDTTVVNAIGVRMGNAESINGTQQTAIVNLQDNTASASSLALLQTAFNNDSATNSNFRTAQSGLNSQFSGNITSLGTTVASNKSSADSSIAALSNSTSSNATSIQVLTAQVSSFSSGNDQINSELIDAVGYAILTSANPPGGASFGRNLSGWGTEENPALWAYIAGTASPSDLIDLRGPIMSATASTRYGASALIGRHRANTHIRLEWLDYNKAVLGNTVPVYGGRVQGGANGDPNNYDQVGCFGDAPAGTVFRRIALRMEGTNQASPYLFTKRWMSWPAPSGSTILPYRPGPALNDNATLVASVSQTQAAIASLDGRVSAYIGWRALGNGETRLEVINGSNLPYGGIIRLVAGQVVIDAGTINFGGSVAFEAATNTFRTNYTGSTVRVIAFGLPFGASNDLFEWIGSSSIPTASASEANAEYAVKANGSAIVGSRVSLGGSLGVTASPLNIAGQGNNTTVFTNASTVNVTGGTAPYTYRWGVFSQSGNIYTPNVRVTTPAANQGAAFDFMSSGRSVTGAIQCVVRDSSNPPKTGTVLIDFSIDSNA